ncbi:uncharacterized protein A1O9_12524 [Exophiala aquamarina CBS 119918]|uniref:C2H2-type domain-containing protein n=1 Tax=Exophiala aquamarina CBS 119918 TaxID=1182545 RepID=A0A072P711_9EURO|nr:uncharacterized protein A1O9_12524 [Exophiala aquamarina CBS 119918]KEF51375.1 hypothetical protein A1O9_12524 [Exophiala aquamarina CBS 119918]
MAEPSPSQQTSPNNPSPTSPSFAKPTATAQHPQKLDTASSREFDESARPGKRPRLDPPQMTAAVAFAQAQQKSPSPVSTSTSPNPSHQALSNLMGANENVVSKAPAASATTDNPAKTVSEPFAEVAQNIEQPTRTSPEVVSSSADNHVLQTSPTSLSSVETLDSMAAATAITTTVGSPLPIAETVRQVVNASEAGSTSPADESPSNKAFSYPAPLLQPPVNESARRGMSLPHSGTRQGTRSPSSKKHRCPYCATEFTRHHNLKSHLLTHSQEKPYVCSTCQSRFRRLHDLKRHTKLHTGERPHICPRCGRKFARGDALARHNKGPGGCAGRRASLGSFGGDDDDANDGSMEGIMYHEPDAMDDEEGNDKRPAIRRQAPSGDDTMDDSDHASRLPSTYPPLQGPPPGGIAGGFFPPRNAFNQPSTGVSMAAGAAAVPLPFPQLSGSTSSSRPSAQGSTVFAPSQISESPKPLSPNQTQRGSVPGLSEGSLGRNRSPSMAHYQQAQYNRVSAPGSLGLPTAPQLPLPPPLNPPDSRYTLPSQSAPAHPPTQPSGPPTHMAGSGPLSSHSNSLSSHHGSGENSNSMFAKEDRLWAYVSSLEQRMNSMQEEINSLKQQLNSAQAQAHRIN